MIRGLDQAAKSLGITPPAQPTKNTRSGKASNVPEEEAVPMMYRAQVEGRCSLMFAGGNEDLERWKDEWIYPKPEQPCYQRKEPPLGLDGKIYRIAVNFPFRLLSNCGQDSILRPILGKHGIPFLSGSSVKGIFRRACVNPDRTVNLEQVKKYCGDDANLAPSKLGVRFHGAYPVGDWAGTHKITFQEKGQSVTEVRYRMLDVVHPQQERQLGSDKKQNATALASVSLYKPRMIFEFSSADPNIRWKEVESIFWRAIALGVGGKTSTGYGLAGYNETHPTMAPSSKASVFLIGQGVSSTLRNDEPEFRPNLFKASLRGHFQRLLAGVVGDRKQLDSEVNRLFGGSSSPGAIQIVWEPRQWDPKEEEKVKEGTFGATKTFKAKGILHLNASRDEDVELIEQVLKFAFIMGGFGKSWRRASHELFHKTYKKFEIGCYWKLDSTDRSWIDIQSPDALRSFLTEIHQNYIGKFGEGKTISLNWREAWHPDRVFVYAAVTQESKAIHLFHDDIFKKTAAIGGRIFVEKFDKKTRKMEEKEQLVFSHVWHRLLPIDDRQYLEIMTVFHRDRNAWSHKENGDQLDRFLQEVANAGLQCIWGNGKPPEKKAKKFIPAPKR
jgi:CRISPR-associated protein Cmr6